MRKKEEIFGKEKENQKFLQYPQPQPILKHSKKIKRCYVVFIPSKAIGMLVKPYYEFLPGNMVKLYWLHLNSEHREKVTTILPKDVVFYKGSLFLIGDYQLIPILSYDMFGKPVEIDPFTSRIVELEKLILALRDKLTILEVEKKTLNKTTLNMLYDIVEALEQVKRSVQMPGQSFYLEENRKVREGEEYE